GKNQVAIIASRNPARAQYWIPEPVQLAAKREWSAFEAALKKFESEKAEREKQSREFIVSAPKNHQPLYAAAETYFAPQRDAARPRISSLGILNELPVAVTFGGSRNAVRLNRLARTSVVDSALAPSRDGAYTGYYFPAEHPAGSAIVTWEPYAGPPSYPE